MSLVNSELRGYTGRLLEGEFLPPVKGKQDRYMPFNDSVSYVENNQPPGWPSSDPPRRASDLHYLTAQHLGAELDSVRVYTAVGSPLDRYHGIDGWMEYNGRRVMFDVTMNPHKRNDYSGKVIVHPDSVDMAALEIADLLR